MKKIVALTGSGISVESGLKTFRGEGGLWEGYPIAEVATPEAFKRNPEMVLRFYNERRRKLSQVEPNAAHQSLANLEDDFEVVVVTQNVDDLHERAGSSKVIHLHGELRKIRSVKDELHIVDCEGDINLGDCAPDGGQWRPHIVWFGEEVPMIETAAAEIATADALVIVGTSLVVYPAAGLVDHVSPHVPVYVVDPSRPQGFWGANPVEYIEANATVGVQHVAERLKQELK